MNHIQTTSHRSKGADPALSRIIEELHSGDRLRIWSIVITIFGDAIVPRGGKVWMGALQAITDQLNIAPGALRAAMSRLASDGWLIREKAGRQSYYCLAEAGKTEFGPATQKVYSASLPDWTGDWEIAIPESDVDAAQLEGLTGAGFATIQPRLFIRPRLDNRPGSAFEVRNVITLTARTGDNDRLKGLLYSGLELDEIAQAYLRLYRLFAPVLERFANSAEIEPIDAITARVLLIHNYRRIILRDPLLPAKLLPDEWPGIPARQLTIDLYGLLLDASEYWLDECKGVENGELPAPDNSLFDRFGGIGNQ